jgi:hypothetical protein
LDQWIAFLQHGLSTCFYCVAPCSFPEELSRKCISSHYRPFPTNTESAQAKDENAAGEGELEARGDVDAESRDVGEREAEGEGKPGVRGTKHHSLKSTDERWEESLDWKLAPLIGEYDVVDYGGRDVEE